MRYRNLILTMRDRRRRLADAGGHQLSLDAVAAIARHLPAGVVAIGSDGRISLFSARAEEMLGHRAADVVGRPALDLIPDALRDEQGRALERLLGSPGDECLGRRAMTQVLRADGSMLDVALTVTRASGRGPAAVVAYLLDVSEERRAATAQRLLADTAKLLGSALDYEATLRGVAALAVPRLADWCAIDLPGPRGRLEPVAIAHADDDKVALGRELRRRYPVAQTDALAQVATMGASFFQPEISDEDLVAYAREQEHLELLRKVGFRSVMIVPLMAGRRTIGAMTFVASESSRRFDEHDLELAEELGRRAGTALENARLYRERTQVARTLIGALRPPAMPPMTGWTPAALYEPADRTEEIGGDFYDVISVPGGWMLVIGDVVGKGPSAAAHTSVARYSLRTAATLTGSPAAALSHLNEDLLREDQDALISAACVLLREGENGAEATIAAAGHPLPVLVSDGAARSVGRSSLILGAAAGATITEETVPIGEGDSLVLYTDGIPDAKGRDERYGFDRLHAALRGPAASSEDLLRLVTDSLENFQHGAQNDDIAMLVVRRERDRGAEHLAPAPIALAATG